MGASAFPLHLRPPSFRVAAVASCHMLTFLWLASKRDILIEAYEDEAVGVLSKNEKGVPWVSAITLHPKIQYGGEKKPTPEEIDALHHEAHAQCYIANSVKSEVKVAKA